MGPRPGAAALARHARGAWQSAPLRTRWLLCSWSHSSKSRLSFVPLGCGALCFPLRLQTPASPFDHARLTHLFPLLPSRPGGTARCSLPHASPPEQGRTVADLPESLHTHPNTHTHTPPPTHTHAPAPFLLALLVDEACRHEACPSTCPCSAKHAQILPPPYGLLLSAQAISSSPPPARPPNKRVWRPRRASNAHVALRCLPHLQYMCALLDGVCLPCSTGGAASSSLAAQP